MTLDALFPLQAAGLSEISPSVLALGAQKKQGAQSRSISSMLCKASLVG